VSVRDNNMPHRRSVRLKSYDYTEAAAYFITICTHAKGAVFGRIDEGRMQMNECGRIADQRWRTLPDHHLNCELDYYVVMPNHVHGILVLHKDWTGTAGRAPTPEAFGRPVSRSIPTIVRSYKSSVSRHIGRCRQQKTRPLWQRGYYEHVIRHERELAAIRRYVHENPLQWHIDHENPDAVEAPEPETD